MAEGFSQLLVLSTQRLFIASFKLSRASKHHLLLLFSTILQPLQGCLLNVYKYHLDGYERPATPQINGLWPPYEIRGFTVRPIMRLLINRVVLLFICF
jgi:hypothetical protein